MKHKLILWGLGLLSYCTVMAQDTFLVKPYLQIGYAPALESLTLLWHTTDYQADWSVEYQVAPNTIWKQSEKPTFKKILVANTPPHRVYHTVLTALKPSQSFYYRVLKNGVKVFESEANAPVSPSKPYRFVAFADIGAETSVQKKLATQALAAKPDFVVVAGDIVYERGLITEYNTRFWPIYNRDQSDSLGSPLMRKVPFISAVGNHDTDTRDLDKYPDALSYYYYWEQPLNGPKAIEGGALVPKLIASPERRTAFEEASGEAYLKMANYSFDYGNAHWLILDSNPYVDYTDKDFQDWVANDLAQAKHATWKFVMFHHPGFNSAREHYEQQHTRLMSPIFEAGGVDVVINGHVHNYQRSFPLRFVPDRKGVLLVAGMGNKMVRGRVVNGSWKLDKAFDGKTMTKPNGIIYLITGAGGQTLYNPEQETDPDSWQKFTDKFFSNVHSLTVADVADKTIRFQQVDVNGKILDTFTITK